MESHGQDGTSVSLPDVQSLLKAKVRLVLNRVMWLYLSNLESVADEHDEAMGKLVDALPDQHKALVHLADHFQDARFDAIRSFVLKSGNDGARELEEMIDNLRISQD